MIDMLVWSAQPVPVSLKLISTIDRNERGERVCTTWLERSRRTIVSIQQGIIMLLISVATVIRVIVRIVLVLL